MKLNPEIKLLKKEVRFLRKTIERQNNELGNLENHIKRMRMNYYQLFLINFIKDLSPRYQKLLSMRFGFEDGITHTLEDIAKEFGVTRERIRQMEVKAIEMIKMRKHRPPEIPKKIKREKANCG